MYKFHVLSEGYSTQVKDGEETKANCTCTLLVGIHNIIVDTMTPWDGPIILEKLSSLNMKPEEINYVISTHGHSDHVGNNNLFLNARHIVGHDVSFKDSYFDSPLSKGDNYTIDDLVHVMPTPGHTEADVTVIATIASGTLAITGDLFECENDLTDERLWLDNSASPQSQRENRAKIIKMANVIVPGHGKPFEVTEEIKGKFRS